MQMAGICSQCGCNPCICGQSSAGGGIVKDAIVLTGRSTQSELRNKLARQGARLPSQGGSP